MSASAVLTVVGYLIGITAFGIWVGRRDRSVTGFFLAGRSAPWWAVAACIIATETSVLTFTSVPGYAYEADFGFLQLAFGFALGRVGIALVLLPAYFRGRVITTYELLKNRFGARVQGVAAAIFLVYRSLADGIRLHAAALMVAIVAGVPEWWCILALAAAMVLTTYELLKNRFGARVQGVAAAIFLVYRSLADGIRLHAAALMVAIVAGVPEWWCILALAAAMVLFSEEGGVKATIWTDVIQLGVYLVGAGVIVLALVEGGAGAPLGWVSEAAAAGRFRIVEPVFDTGIPYTIWAGLLGGIFLTFATHGTDQFLAQRLLAARSLRQAQAGLVLSGVGAVMQFCLFLFIGAWLHAHYGGREFGRPDEVLPTFVAETLSGPAAGITLAAVVAAALSPSLVSLASTTVRDFWLPWRQRREGEGGARPFDQVRAGRWFVVVWGLVQTGVALLAQRAPSALEAGLAALSYASGPTVGAFGLALVARRAPANAVLVGMAAGFLAPAAIRLGGLPLAWTWDVMVGSLTTVLLGLLTARLLPAATPTPKARP